MPRGRRICKGCAIEKPLSGFEKYNAKGGRELYRSRYCAECEDWYQRHKIERIRPSIDWWEHHMTNDTFYFNAY